MTLSLLTGLAVLIAAASIGALERAMNPDMKRFPCVNRKTIWVLRAHTVFLVFASFDRLAREAPVAAMIRATWPDAYVAAPLEATWFQLGAAGSMATAYATLLVMVLKLRLNKGVWPRLQARHARVSRLNKMGGPLGAVLAKQAADADVPIAAPLGIDPSMASVLTRLSRLP